MNEDTEHAINAVYRSRTAFCKFISANDAGSTRAHQSGFYIPRNSLELMPFKQAGVKGNNMDCLVKIKWQDNFVTESRFIYYGSKTRNEYRLTRFGKGFPFLKDEYVGDLLILCRMEDTVYEGYVLSSDEDTEDFFSVFNLTSEQTNKIIEKEIKSSPEIRLRKLIDQFVQNASDFPDTYIMSEYARDSYLSAFKIGPDIINRAPDTQLLRWLNAEYELFKAFEVRFYGGRIKTPFATVDELIDFSNKILNRRKSRAGKSLEHHLSAIFTYSKLKFESQIITEGNKRPDFIFPGSEAYHNFSFPANNLVFMGAKTTCKDRWRQIINEADRIENKYLFTLQQGISKNQLSEMYSNRVSLVVPKPYLHSFDKSFQEKIITLDQFIGLVREKQS